MCIDQLPVAPGYALVTILCHGPIRCIVGALCVDQQHLKQRVQNGDASKRVRAVLHEEEGADIIKEVGGRSIERKGWTMQRVKEIELMHALSLVLIEVQKVCGEEEHKALHGLGEVPVVNLPRRDKVGVVRVHGVVCEIDDMRACTITNPEKFIEIVAMRHRLTRNLRQLGQGHNLKAEAGFGRKSKMVKGNSRLHSQFSIRTYSQTGVK